MNCGESRKDAAVVTTRAGHLCPKQTKLWALHTFQRYLNTVVNSNSQEHRRELRHRTRFQAVLKNADLEENAQVTNVSLSGLQLECSREVFNILQPSILHPDPRSPLQANVLFTIPSGHGDANLELPCQLLYARRLSKDRYLIGARICREDMPADDNQLGRLRDYLRDHSSRVK